MDLAVVQGSKGKADRWVRAFREAGVLCVAEQYIVDWLAHPHASLAVHHMFGSTPSTRLQRAEAQRSAVTPADAAAVP